MRLIGVILLAFVLASGALVCRAAGPVSAEQAEALIEESPRVTGCFYEQTAAGRLAFLCLDRFLDAEQRESVYRHSTQAGGELAAILEKQRQALDGIENYEGADWEARYGQTRLWARLDQACRMSDCQLAAVTFWRALSGPAREKQAMLEDVKQRCRATGSRWAGLEDFYYLLAAWQQGIDRQEMEALLGRFKERSDISESARDRSLLLYQRFDRAERQADLQAFFDAKVQGREDYEWCLEYAFLDYRQGRSKALRAVSRAWPPMDPYLSQLILSYLDEVFQREGAAALGGQDALAVSLAGRGAAESPHPERYADLLTALIRVSPQAAVFDALGRACLQSDPVQALQHFSRAAELTVMDSSLARSEVTRLAKSAAYHACVLYPDDRLSREAILGILDQSLKHVSDPELLLAAADIYVSQGKAVRAKALLVPLAGGQDAYAVKAQVRLKQLEIDELLTGDGLAALEAIASAAADLQGEGLRADQVEKAAGILEAFLWDLETGQADDIKLDRLLPIALACKTTERGALLWAEFACLNGSLSAAEKAEIQAILARNEGQVSPEFLRARARWAMAEGQWAEALASWQALRRTWEPDSADPQGRRPWWQCRYYELVCYRRLPGVTAEQVKHAVEVLLASHPSIPEAWEKKIKQL